MKKQPIKFLVLSLMFFCLVETVRAGPSAANVGKLEIIATSATLRLVRGGQMTCLAPAIRLQIRNTSDSDMKIVLDKDSIQLRDDLGGTMFPIEAYMFRISGISSPRLKSYTNPTGYMVREKDQWTVLSSEQHVEVQIATDEKVSNMRCVKDLNSEFYNSYKPTHFSIFGTLGTVDSSSKAELRGFSLVDKPLELIGK